VFIHVGIKDMFIHPLLSPLFTLHFRRRTIPPPGPINPSHHLWFLLLLFFLRILDRAHGAIVACVALVDVRSWSRLLRLTGWRDTALVVRSGHNCLLVGGCSVNLWDCVVVLLMVADFERGRKEVIYTYDR